MNEDCLKHGAFGWTELMTTDTGAAKQFYSSLFGWETEAVSIEGGEYTVVKVDGEAVGGIMGMPPDCSGMPPSWDVYVTVNDVDAVAGNVESLGGKVLRPPADIPKIGRFCVIQDPQGAIICAISYGKD